MVLLRTQFPGYFVSFKRAVALSRIVRFSNFCAVVF
jgi:hypothetical protein